MLTLQITAGILLAFLVRRVAIRIIARLAPAISRRTNPEAVFLLDWLV